MQNDQPTDASERQDAPGEPAVPEGAASPAETSAPAGDGGGEDSASPELATLQKDLDKFRDLALRSQADFENFRKRASREREEAIRYANATLIEELLPILDNFELGMAAAAADPSASLIVQGFSMVQKQFADLLRAQGAEPVDASPGEVFDPKIHEALGQENSGEIPEGAIIRQVRRGWRLKDRLLRAATVYVSRGPDGAATSSGE